MNADQSHRHRITGRDREGHHHTIILWREVDLVDGKVVRRVVVMLDTTVSTATVLTLPQAGEVGQAILEATQ